jgi:collagenase-like PrtC family protease
MTEHHPKLALGPVLYYWPKDKLLDFYERIAPCRWRCLSRRNGLLQAPRAEYRRLAGLAERLSAAGKEVVLSTMALLEAESELKTLRRLCENGRFTVEANDLGAVRLLSDRGCRSCWEPASTSTTAGPCAFWPGWAPSAG